MVLLQFTFLLFELNHLKAMCLLIFSVHFFITALIEHNGSLYPFVVIICNESFQITVVYSASRLKGLTPTLTAGVTTYTV
nr:MAG TPA: hypothetical protein [Caudoviricetes sp.]